MPKLVWRTKLMAELQPNMTTEISPPQFCMLSWEAGGTVEPSAAPAPAQVASEPAEQRDTFEDAKAALRAELERRAAELGIAPRELFSADKQQASREKEASRARKPRENEGAKRAVKYQSPTGEEWSGRGREPGWLKALIAHGHSKDEYRVG